MLVLEVIIEFSRTFRIIIMNYYRTNRINRYLECIDILGVGDALGVDWSSLVAIDAKQPSRDIPTTAKQKWQTHHIFLDVGISMYLAGESYAKHLLTVAQQKLDEELEEQQKPKCVANSDLSNDRKPIKEEPISATDSDNMKDIVPSHDGEEQTDIDTSKSNEKLLIKSNEMIKSEQPTAVKCSEKRELHPLACVQVAERKCYLRRQQLIANICGPNSRALSARQDLKFRRQLCGLPTSDLSLMTALPIVNNKLKSLALSMFQRTNEINVK